MQSIQNLGLALIAMAAGAILDTRGYLFLEVFFCFCICCKYFVCVWVNSLTCFEWRSYLFALACIPVALMAVVTLYFVDYLRGERRLEPWTVPPLQLAHSSFSSHDISSLKSRHFLSTHFSSHSPPFHKCSLLNLSTSPFSFLQEEIWTGPLQPEPNSRKKSLQTLSE